MKVHLLLLISFYLVSHLQGQNWVRQNPNPIISTLSDVFVNDQGNGISVGSDNAIITTIDNGITWIIEDKGFEDWDFTGVVYVGNDTWIVSGSKGLIISIDQGQTWTMIQVDIGNIMRLDIFDNLIVATSESHIARSQDQGSSWEILEGITNDHFEVFFLDETLGWLTDDKQRILYQTVDGGQNWNIIYEHDGPSGQKIDEISFTSAMNGFLFVSGNFLSTVDGGINWEYRYETPFTNQLKDLVVTPTSRFITQSPFGTFYSSDDEGYSWKRHNDIKKFGNKAGRLRVSENGAIWTTNQYTSIIRSIDNGEAYTEQVGGYKETLRDIEMYDENFGVATSSAEEVLITTNGGGTWTPSFVDDGVSSISYVIIESPQKIKIACTGAVYETVDGGMSWTKLLTTNGANTGFYRLGESTFIVISSRKTYYRTEDDGQSWTEVLNDNGVPGNVQKAYFLDENHGWAVGFDGYVKKSIDGGLTWGLMNIPDNGGSPFYDVEFTNPNDGWILDNSNLYRTSDAGLNWTTVNLSGARASNVIFFDEDEGFIFGSHSGNKVYLRTSNGGDTWTESLNSSNLSINDIEQSADGEKMWICGEGGNIEVSVACGDSPTISAINTSPKICASDTVTATISFEHVTLFDWVLPEGWRIIGNINSNQVMIKIGESSGEISVAGSNGCEVTSASSAMIEVIQNFENVDIIRAGDLLSLGITADSYQWFLNGLAIDGADEPTLKATVSGTYSVEIAMDSCSKVLSNMYNYVISSSSEQIASQLGYIFPNPSNGYINFSLAEPDQKVQIYIYDLSGRLIDHFDIIGNNAIDLRHLKSNVYAIKWLTPKYQGVSRLIIE